MSIQHASNVSLRPLLRPHLGPARGNLGNPRAVLAVVGGTVGMAGSGRIMLARSSRSCCGVSISISSHCDCERI